MKITMQQAHTFMINGDIPMLKICFTMRLRRLQRGAVETDIRFFVKKMVQHPHQRHRLRQQRGESRATDTPVKYENEYRGKHKVAPHGKHRREHGLLRIARGSHHVVKAYHHIRNWRTEKNHLHKVAGIGSVAALAPKKRSIGSRNKNVTPP